jgi:hypothetical protein
LAERYLSGLNKKAKCCMTSLEQARLQVASDLITLAQRDAVAMRVLAEVPEVAFAILGFHAQQCVEKSLTAVMITSG